MHARWLESRPRQLLHRPPLWSHSRTHPLQNLILPSQAASSRVVTFVSKKQGQTKASSLSGGGTQYGQGYSGSSTTWKAKSFYKDDLVTLKQDDACSGLKRGDPGLVSDDCGCSSGKCQVYFPPNNTRKRPVFLIAREEALNLVERKHLPPVVTPVAYSQEPEPDTKFRKGDQVRLAVAYHHGGRNLTIPAETEGEVSWVSAGGKDYDVKFKLSEKDSIQVFMLKEDQLELVQAKALPGSASPQSRDWTEPMKFTIGQWVRLLVPLHQKTRNITIPAGSNGIVTLVSIQNRDYDVKFHPETTEAITGYLVKEDEMEAIPDPTEPD